MLLGLLLALPVSAVVAVEKTHGVSDSLLPKYVPTSKGSSSVWTCLDGSKTISWSSVNDDYCDCPDGSDEPGTFVHGSASIICTHYLPVQVLVLARTARSTVEMKVT